KILHRRYAAQHIGEQHIKNCAEHERPKNSNRHVALRISGFLRRGRNSIETDIGEEDNASSAQNTEDSAVGVRDALGRSVSRRWRTSSMLWKPWPRRRRIRE